MAIIACEHRITCPECFDPPVLNLSADRADPAVYFGIGHGGGPGPIGSYGSQGCKSWVWAATQEEADIMAARQSVLCDDPCPDTSYPIASYCEQDAIPINFGKPPPGACVTGVGRPTTWGFQFQTRLVIRGWCRVRGLMLYAWWREKKPYQGLACHVTSPNIGALAT